MYIDVVTLYNRYNDVWHGVVLRGVDLNADRGAIVAKYGSDSKDNAKLHIKYAEGIVVQGLQYVSPMQYTGASGTFTLAFGNDFSFFVEGDTGLYVADDTDYLDGFYDYMNRTHDRCYAITSVARYSVIPHFEVLAR